MNLTLKRTPAIYLVGFMGSGKSTVGRMLAEHLGWPFADLDTEIEKDQRTSINEIFSTRGEEAFRQIEHEALRKCVKRVQSGRPLVLSLGGGAFTRAENIALLSGNGISIWLDTTFDVVKHRVEGASHRPLARDPVRFKELFESRREAYARADQRITLEVDDSRQALARILELPIWT